jgi:ABC-type sugar transport system substrate-binding protein
MTKMNMMMMMMMMMMTTTTTTTTTAAATTAAATTTTTTAAAAAADGECKNKTRSSNNGDNWKHLKIIQKLPEQHKGSHANKLQET